ncbi:4-coumarate--CoA ligase 1-like [Diprion similis]|uniref:4-coumarate--CoA ligase 1-like n=1 Tax=Diprion similis TaxID=362088 RepID=UPI001EF902D3|nr:4-coumarate--CoA ligase 1-like [Diprion similis]
MPSCNVLLITLAEFQDMNDSRFTLENNVLKGKVVPYPPFEYNSYGELILSRLKNSPKLVGQIDGTTGEEYTYDQMRDRSVRCALWMKAHGLLPGDVVVVCDNQHLDVALPCFAALYVGAIFNPLYVGMTKRDFCHMMKTNVPKMAFVNEELAATCAAAAEEINLDLKIVVFGRVPGFFEFEKIITEQEVEEVENYKCTPVKSSHDTAVILCTSGTSGLPKGVALSHIALLKVQARPALPVLQADKSFIVAPPAWVTGTFAMLLTVCANATRLLLPPFDEYTACALIEKLKIHSAFLPVYTMNRLVKSDAVNKYDLSSLKNVTSSGSIVSVAVREAFVKAIPSATITVGYGMTEVGGVIIRQSPGSKFGSSGHVLEDSQLKVVDPSTGQVQGPNKEGELWLKSSTMMNGYYNNPQATAKAMDEEGWMHSGDLGYYDEDGEIFVVDRLKELIKYRGYHISPADIEDVLLPHPGVKEVAVIGLPHPLDDEHPVAFVVRAESSVTDEKVTEQQLIDLVATEMGDFSQLRGGVKFVDSLPKTESYKTLRRYLRDLATSMAAS